MLNVGIDIGGTKIAGGVVADDGRIVERLRVSTPADTGALAQAVADMVGELAARHDVHAVGVAAAGYIDRTRSVMLHAPNIDWHDAPLREEFESRIGRSVTLENDANAAGWGEYRFGAGQGATDMVMLTLGTGVGGAVVGDGQLLIGANGSAAELGHVRFVRGGRPCGCGQSGCLEQYASGRALQREIADIIDAGEIGARLAAHRGASGIVAGRDLANLLDDGDVGALEAIRRVATALGEACGAFQAVLDPELYVIGGGVADLGERLLEPTRIAYETSLPGFGERPTARFVTASLGNDAGLVGVADLAGLRSR
ncbi:MAG: glucokinase [Microbacterium sp. SCN 70-27]|uniref:ROK family protein n=1 Tax=unclassified Microbacterium TaxID=2609290 RepID=UPI00086D046E|nr:MULTISPECIES: ROK family protein [unclassified Microbacterium]MBN9225104.1 ROK family protein [Microbacterium sp.]ODT27897.1 MAG: glucokinase [Microbacterium sp. SCN 70-27]